MRTLIVMGCGIVAAGLSGCALDASRIYTNEHHCFAVLKPAGMTIETQNQGAIFTFGKRCRATLGECTDNLIAVNAAYLFSADGATYLFSTDADPLAELTEEYESQGWVSKPDGGFGRARGWRQQTLFKGSSDRQGTADQQREVHIYARMVRRSEGVPTVGYYVIAEFDSPERETYKKSVLEVLTSWRMLEACTDGPILLE
jgi:hypothetical protein